MPYKGKSLLGSGLTHYPLLPRTSKHLKTRAQKDRYYFEKLKPKFDRVMNLTPNTFHEAADQPTPADHLPEKHD